MTGVYFIQAGGVRGPVKIGSAENFAARMHELQTGNAARLYVLGGHLLAGRSARLRLEHSIHRQFAYSRIRGEWFKPHLWLFQHIDEECDLNLLPYPPLELGKFLDDRRYVPAGARFGDDMRVAP